MQSKWKIIVLLMLLTSSCENLEISDDILNELPDSSTISSSCIDLDQDGYAINCTIDGNTDCDDNNKNEYPGALELCDYLDNDCNGIVDEMMNVGYECTIDGCNAIGFIDCDDDGFTYCNTSLVGEVCNGIDDNCDGEIDEDNPDGGEPCEMEDPGVCNEGEWTCIGGALGCMPLIQVGAQEETCNGLDDDCDGDIDEGLNGNPLTDTCYTGPDGTLGHPDALCQEGQWACVEGRWGPCIGQIRPTSEICDGLDNDCNGVVDDNFDVMSIDCACEASTDTDRPCYTGDPLTEDVGGCHAGTSTCIDNADDDTWGVCTGEVTPTDEICDGQDNDCDGQVDEDFNLNQVCTLGVGVCQADGVNVCNAEHAAVCNATPGTPTVEICNGVDDDCDGLADDVAGFGDSCTVGVTECQRSGTKVCNVETNELVCNIEPAPPQIEVCDGLDNDCDEVVDNGFLLGQPCTVGVGACERSGVYECSFDGTSVCNVQPGGPSAEVCDGLDNDCDGEIDEGFGLGNICIGNGVCGGTVESPIYGTLECSLGIAICSTNPSGSEDLSTNELCDSLDNDCDGEVDEDYYFEYGSGLVDECTEACGDGVYECAANQTDLVCSTAESGSVSQPEICDGIDNDCDYSVDEDCPDTDMDGIVDALDDDDDGDGSLDVDDCEPLNASIYPGNTESCNGIDDNCDTVIDEGCP